ncbi:AbrB/MazE/SpoVT family DNA-binding domain-containing protein [Labrys wisconsinensis]|uniref:Uncharacterized protein n=1 Tax=Labrys wisconsinensis TaxID=425677 RepID=A0ABU0J2B1_9HYPH|nr:AbrB/MazE/SpoVT family DNA-binding domain-containing protein [Labrys wisconsinensis]MDQ0467701.1 hypothetical protein [Labrys wisconsinensis]
MTTPSVTTKGQVDEIAVQALSPAPIEPLAAEPTGTIDGFIGFLAGKTGRVLTIDEIGEIVAAGWAAER